MEVILSPRFVLTARDQTVYLVDRSSGAKIWPEDVIQPYPNWGFGPASEHVERMARSAMLKPDQRTLVEQFCDDHRSRNAGSPRSNPPAPPRIRRIDS
ncbi:hypothetical protein [Haloferula sp. A504]|uniref:hypothetical protein n=1 Tax=Haloferula sp. A504 TaxID=3373601 RepID=UPI0031C4A3D5|nr:hypothetical protein [Verrucomicrobiaceae bacterium E54]